MVLRAFYRIFLKELFQVCGMIRLWQWLEVRLIRSCFSKIIQNYHNYYKTLQERLILIFSSFLIHIHTINEWFIILTASLHNKWHIAEKQGERQLKKNILYYSNFKISFPIFSLMQSYLLLIIYYMTRPSLRKAICYL